MYRGRWRIEGHFQTLTDLLHCEVPGLGYPRAALFAFSMSAVAGNAPGGPEGEPAGVHGTEMAAEASDFALVDEIAEVYPEMMVAVPPARWPSLARRRAATVAGLLNELAERVPVHRMFAVPARPEEASAETEFGKRIHHVSNKKLLDRAVWGAGAG